MVMDRMNLTEVVPALRGLGFERMANFFDAYTGNETYTVDNVWIDKEVIEDHIGPKSTLMMALECECQTWMS